MAAVFDTITQLLNCSAVLPGLFPFQRLLSDRSAKFCPVAAKKRPFFALSHPQLLIFSKTLDCG
jgi:hypothetical protein